MFNVDTLRAEAKHEPFVFVLDGEEQQLPHVRTLTAEHSIALDEGKLRETLPEVIGAERAARLLALETFALEALVTAWLEHAGLTSGESPASTGS
jgi:hypothetical protein